MPGQVPDRSAGGDHVDESKQRRTQLTIPGRKLHRVDVKRAHRMARRARKRSGEPAADLPDLALELPWVNFRRARATSAHIRSDGGMRREPLRSIGGSEASDTVLPGLLDPAVGE